LVLHEISDLPKKKHCPDIDLLELMHPAQSAFEYPWIWSAESLENSSPRPGQVSRYFRILVATL
jgi:hypothetical protein